MGKVIYTDAPTEVEEAIERGKVLDITIDELIARQCKKRITIMLDAENLEFFKNEAKAHGIPYQTMINNSLTATRTALQRQAAQ